MVGSTVLDEELVEDTACYKYHNGMILKHRESVDTSYFDEKKKAM